MCTTERMDDRGPAMSHTTRPLATPVPASPPADGSAATSPRAWEDVLAHIESRLVSGDLAPGDHLPSERTLASGLGVSRSSVREALRVLEVLGLLRTQAGSGPESGAIIIARPSGGMSSLLRLQVAAQGFRVDDVVSTRLILETAVAAQLAERVALAGAASIDLTAATEILDAMEATGEREPTSPEFLALDAQFHFSLAEAAGNDVIAAMMTGLRNSIEGYSIAGARNLASWSSTATRLKREHRSIIRAIEAGDSHAARTAVTGHITGYYAEAGFGQPTPLGSPTATSPNPK
ncbi:FadR/GntR family transcriptional regulator [Subtercola frigoramans]|uniref:DNA-binding FadR family transcriptional regulator n=2 Tax=Subtercola frigoramans TaxID=120298 RepID=A0ABS2L099_9MICO|nr:FCD domain-containing protein [Subtercola frigoramans]MBM7470500.1 DNA-binding FadR family transcriptional regulator [Subtercola frigoramans]